MCGIVNVLDISQFVFIEIATGDMAATMHLRTGACSGKITKRKRDEEDDDDFEDEYEAPIAKVKATEHLDCYTWYQYISGCQMSINSINIVMAEFIV